MDSRTIEGLITGLEFIIVVLIGVAYITLGERKVMGSMQRRVGPNIIGIYGILQPIVDGVKLFMKERSVILGLVSVKQGLHVI